MTACICVLGRVAIGRVIAAERYATLLARSQMDPGSADLHALFAFRTVRTLDMLDCVEMRAASIIHRWLERLPFGDARLA
jgi:hypothetical protein